MIRLPNSESFRIEFEKSFLSSGSPPQLLCCRFQYTTSNFFVKERMYAAMGSKNQPRGENSSSANAASVSCFSFQWTERCAAFPDKECRTADCKGREAASFEPLRPPQRGEKQIFRNFYPPLTMPWIACILCIVNSVHVEVIR